MISLLRRGPTAEGLVCLEMHPEGLGVARLLDSPGGPPRLTLCDFHGGGAEPAAAAVARQLRDCGAAGSRCVVALSPELYSLHLVDAPDVQPEEFAASARWLIRDLVDFPAEDAAIDYFEVPQQQRGEGPKRIYVVVAQARVVQEVVDLAERCSLHLESIEVTETGLGLLANRIAREGDGLALVQLGRRGGLIEMTRQGVLQMVRRLESGLDELGRPAEPWGDESLPLDGEDGNESYDSLVLEIQRSLDYYESQLGEPPVPTLWLAPFEDTLPDLLPFLEKSLTVDVRALELSDLFEFEGEASAAARAHCLAALGAGLGALQDAS